MSPRPLTLFPLLLLLALATGASAQDDVRSGSIQGGSSAGLDQVVYKGLVGNALDAVPMDASQRVGLQRTNAVVSSTLFGRSLAALVGFSNPVMLLGGLAWGIWAASNIEPAETDIASTTGPRESGDRAETQERLVALLASPATLDDTPRNSGSAPVVLSSLSAGDADAAALLHPQVIKIWLPQRSSTPPR